LTGFGTLLLRELLLSVRHGTEAVAAVLFFLLTTCLVPLAVGPEAETLRQFGPGLIWISALLATLLPLERTYGAEMEDGSLDQLVLSGAGLTTLAWAKTSAHFLVTGLPLVLAAVPAGLMLQLGWGTIGWLVAGLMLGTPALSVLGTTIAALAAGARRGGMLLPLLVLPLACPVLIFGAAATGAEQAGESGISHLKFLAAILLVAASTGPWVAAAALRSHEG
jgi:heme exporter protein B